MSSTASTIVAVNTGSSSIKLTVFAINHGILGESPLLAVSMSNIGEPVAILKVAQSGRPTHTEKVRAPSHVEAAHFMLKQLASTVAPSNILAIGHRLVHGGIKYTHPTVIETVTETDWTLLSRLDPNHTPAARQLIDQFTQHYPDVPSIACFDTSFFSDMPMVAKIIPIPQKYYADGVRRYGFHGLSYTSLLATFRKQAGVVAANGRVILAHLGSGASLAAVRDGKPIDTTMGFTPTSGIVMSTRSGDLDPNIFSFLHQKNNLSVNEFNHMVSSESGLLGISQLTGDMRTLLELEKNNENAALAVELFVRDVKKSIGALATTMGGVSSLIFSGGIGEQSAVLRTRICEGLEYMGIELNEDTNAEHAFLISSSKSNAGVHVIPANEARVIAMQTHALLAEKDKE